MIGLFNELIDLIIKIYDIKANLDKNYTIEEIERKYNLDTTTMPPIMATEDGSDTDLYNAIITSANGKVWIKFYLDANPSNAIVTNVGIECVDIDFYGQHTDCINLDCFGTDFANEYRDEVLSTECKKEKGMKEEFTTDERDGIQTKVTRGISLFDCAKGMMSLAEMISIVTAWEDWRGADGYEFIADLEASEDYEDFKGLYGSVTANRCRAIGRYWMCGYNFYANEDDKDSFNSNKIWNITDDNINGLLKDALDDMEDRAMVFIGERSLEDAKTNIEQLNEAFDYLVDFNMFADYNGIQYAKDDEFDNEELDDYIYESLNKFNGLHGEQIRTLTDAIFEDVKNEIFEIGGEDGNYNVSDVENAIGRVFINKFCKGE